MNIFNGTTLKFSRITLITFKCHYFEMQSTVTVTRCCSVTCQPGRCGLPSHLYCLFREPRPTSASGLSASLHH